MSGSRVYPQVVGRAGSIVAAMVVALACGASAAHAAGAALTEDFAVRFDAQPLEVNVVEVARHPGGGVVVRDAGALVSPGPGCTADGPGAVRCPTARAAEVDVADGDDVVNAAGSPVPVMLEGGPGRDVLVGSRSRDWLMGGEDADQLFGRQGNDDLFGERAAIPVPDGATQIDVGGVADDLVDGGSGSDAVSYEGRLPGVTVDLRAGTGGSAGERDVVRAVERVYGSMGADILRGDDGANRLHGDMGRDRLVGRGGRDQLVSGHRVQAGAGNDRVSELDRGARVSCGSGRDSVAAPARGGRVDRDCETVRRAARAGA